MFFHSCPRQSCGDDLRSMVRSTLRHTRNLQSSIPLDERSKTGKLEVNSNCSLCLKRRRLRSQITLSSTPTTTKQRAKPHAKAPHPAVPRIRTPRRTPAPVSEALAEDPFHGNSLGATGGRRRRRHHCGSLSCEVEEQVFYIGEGCPEVHYMEDLGIH